MAIAFLGLANGTSRAASATAPVNSRYVYCNVYLTDACFGLAGGDVMKMELPADFVLRTVSLWNGTQVVIYEGHQPEDAFKDGTAKTCPSAGDAKQCQYTTSGSSADVMFQASNTAQTIHLHITGITKHNWAGVMDFLSGFHLCKAVGQSEQCSDERPFVGIH
ncbi:MAG: hypothetical protein KGK04_09720 [Xanthomonadaceae bacterium]|nr:hypothetical protein [Xanthomonadaceae bacterium]